MSNTKSYIEKLFAANAIVIGPSKRTMFEAFASKEENIEKVRIIQKNQNEMIEKFQILNRISDIMQHPVQIPNGTVGKAYESQFDFIKLGWNDVVYSEFEGLEDYGLHYDNQSELISGTPTQNGEFKIKLKFRVTGEAEDSVLNEKLINLIINADPKSLWKNLDSDKKDPFWKADNVSEFKPIGDKHIVVSSKRGRSHANVGSFRDDDYAFNHFENTSWSIVAVSDGAGSAKASRKGSTIACEEVVAYFKNNLTNEVSNQFDELLNDYNKESNGADIVEPVPTQNSETNSENAVVAEEVETTKNKIGKFIYNNLGGCAKTVYNKLEEFATLKEINIKELHSTLIFTLFKKYEFGYVVLTFGVGDCPIGVINKDQTDFKLMNWLDVGEFGGGTRFITMPEIFVSDKFPTRFGFKIIDDFSYLMLMTDGIYDAKFVVEANLEKLEKWKEFIADLEGNNEDKAKVVFDKNNAEIAGQLSVWMDFWSPGNHDDRTLAVIF
jgi:serine/threonine protein phosphatase PrpC